MSAAEQEQYLSEFLLHPYICERCFGDVPLTEHEYRKALDDRGRLLCESCWETLSSKGETRKGRGARRGNRRGSASDG